MSLYDESEETPETEIDDGLDTLIDEPDEEESEIEDDCWD